MYGADHWSNFLLQKSKTKGIYKVLCNTTIIWCKWMRFLPLMSRIIILCDKCNVKCIALAYAHICGPQTCKSGIFSCPNLVWLMFIHFSQRLTLKLYIHCNHDYHKTVMNICTEPFFDMFLHFPYMVGQSQHKIS